MSSRKVQKYTEDFLKLTLDLSWTSDEKHEFRVSSFPYCPVLDLEARKNTTREETFGKEFYTRIGTKVHELLQEKKPLVKKYGNTVFGHWKCMSCKRISGMGFHDEKRKDLVKTCNTKDKCSARFEYEEIAFKYGPIPLSGHLDLLTVFESLWIAFEFKTTGGALFLPNSFVERFFPQAKHNVQICIYCTLLRMLYGIRVDYFNIIYINRDKPNSKIYTFEFTEALYEKFRARIIKASKGRVAVNKWLRFKKIKYLKNILKYKPCKNYTSYLGYMKFYFFNKDHCPFAENGQCFNKPNKMIKSIILSSKKLKYKTEED